MQEPSIFTRIINGEVPCHKIYEDDYTLAFLDIHPIQPGHTLVVPKRQIEFVWDLDDATYQHVMTVTQRVAAHIRNVMGVPYVGMQIMGTDVPHAHIHLIPFTSPEQFRQVADMTLEPDHELLSSIAEKLRF